MNLWLRREQETGDFKAIVNYQTGKKPKITNFQRFEEFVLQHNAKTQQRIAKLWGENLTQQNVSDAMKKLGITRKKTYGYRERDEEKRKQFLERISQIEQSKIVYVDKAGFNNREDRCALNLTKPVASWARYVF